jgi:hypothetical protein
LVSANGPSTTVRFLPENWTRTPLELGFSPSPDSMIPALASSSLNFVISFSSCSVGRMPSSESFVALTMTMTRIAISLKVG